MALFAAGALAKETVLPALVLVPLYLVARSGRVRGLLDTAVIAAPGLALAILLRVSWGAPVPATPSFSILDVTIGRLLGSGWLLVNAAVLSGLVLPAFIGLGRETSIVLRVQGVLLWTFTFGLIFANPYHYAAADLRRLSAFAWPALLPLALSGLGFVRTPLSNTPPRRERLRSTVSVLVLLICVGLVAATDPYQRAPFPASPDPVALVGRIRESLKTARALDAGETFTFDARSGRFARPIAETFNLTEGRRQRWFLYRGFGRAAPYAGGLPEFRRDADLILPILDPRQATMFMDFESPSDSAEVTLHLAGLALGTIRTNGRPGKVLVPREALVRGDNTLRVSAADGAAVRLARWEVFLEARGPPRK
jgi:hypothetical protein